MTSAMSGNLFTVTKMTFSQADSLPLACTQASTQLLRMPLIFFSTFMQGS